MANHQQAAVLRSLLDIRERFVELRHINARRLPDFGRIFQRPPAAFTIRGGKVVFPESYAHRQ